VGKNLNTKELVELITVEVIKRLKLKNKKKLLVLNEGFKSLDDLLTDYEIIHYSEDLELKDFDEIYLGKMDLKMISHLANGIIINEIEDLILKSLLKDKKIFLFSEDIELKKFNNTKNTNLYKIFNQNIENIKNIGIIILDEKIDIKENININTKYKNEVKEEDSIILKNKLITENELKKLGLKNGSKINIGNKSIITPLAKDYIRIHKIRLTKSQEEKI
jgi:ethanolamine utilization protein